MKPLEPMKDAEINYVSLQTTFLLDLASGKYHSKIHAWVTTSQIEDSLEKVALLFSSDFIKQSQLSREVAQSVSPVIISALTTVVDSLKRTGLYTQYYLDLKDDRSVLFMSFNNDYMQGVGLPCVLG